MTFAEREAMIERLNDDGYEVTCEDGVFRVDSEDGRVHLSVCGFGTREINDLAGVTRLIVRGLARACDPRLPETAHD